MYIVSKKYITRIDVLRILATSRWIEIPTLPKVLRLLRVVGCYTQKFSNRVSLIIIFLEKCSNYIVYMKTRENSDKMLEWSFSAVAHKNNL